jgi:protein-S-isoprenylcysteine O-methyltransferase Ste14
MSTSPWVILLAVLIYGFVHSLLATSGIKARFKEWFGVGVGRWYRLAYNTFGILTFMPILALVAFLPDNEIYVIPAPWSYIALAGQLLALVALVIGLLQTGIYSFLGFEQMLKPSPTSTPQMVTNGLYRWVRHPLYTAGLAFIWLTAIMTSNLLALNIGLTLYLIIGAIYEERKLVREFGDKYTSYQERVPILIPRLVRKRPAKGSG